MSSMKKRSKTKKHNTVMKPQVKVTTIPITNEKELTANF